MEALVFAVLLALCLLFSGVLLFGAPYLPTLRPQIETALDLLELHPGDTVLELGCGDGKVLITAAERGYRVVGIELNPLLVCVAWFRTRRYRSRVTILWGNFWRMDWPESDGVYVFLLDRFMDRLDSRMRAYRRPVVSVAFQIPQRKPSAQRSGVFLYNYR